MLSDNEGQIDPQIVHLKLLTQIKRLFASTIQEGVIEPLRPRTITTTLTVVTPPYAEKAWFGVKISNDGANSVYVNVNTEKSEEIEIKPDETWGVHFPTAVITNISLRTETGTSTVRIRGER